MREGLKLAACATPAYTEHMPVDVERAFTLIELITAIAIIAILASVALVGLSNVRTQSRIKSAEHQMENARLRGVVCASRGIALNPPQEGDFMCGTEGTIWPELPGDWAYEAGTFGTDLAMRTFSFSATGDGITVSCDPSECIST